MYNPYEDFNKGLLDLYKNLEEGIRSHIEDELLKGFSSVSVHCEILDNYEYCTELSTVEVTVDLEEYTFEVKGEVSDIEEIIQDIREEYFEKLLNEEDE